MRFCLRSLPYRDPQRLVSIFEDISVAGFPRNTPSPGNYAACKALTQIFADTAATTERVYNLTGGPGARSGDPEELQGTAVTQNLFPMLGVKPVLGRLFMPEEDRPGGPHVMLIGHGLWMRRFGGDPGLMGREILLNSEKYTVLGVMPPGFSYPFQDVEDLVADGFHTRAAGRLRHALSDRGGQVQPGVTVAQANAALAVLSKRLARTYPETNKEIQRFFAEPLQDSLYA